MPYVADHEDFAGQCLEPVLALRFTKTWPSISSICRGQRVSCGARGAASDTAAPADSKISHELGLPWRVCLLFPVEQSTRCSLGDHRESKVGLCQVPGIPGAPGA